MLKLVQKEIIPFFLHESFVQSVIITYEFPIVILFYMIEGQETVKELLSTPMLLNERNGLLD